MSTTKVLQGAQPPEPHLQPKRNPYKGLVIFMWVLFILGLLSFFALFIGVSGGLFGKLPTFTELENPKNALASEVYSDDDELLGKFYIYNRSNATYNEIPEHLIDALVATEDIRFYEHSGIDGRGSLRVLYKTILLGQDAGGGSTITQQLAKNLFHDPRGNILERVKQKLKEWVIAVKLEKGYTKEEILTMYLNTVPFSDNAHGIKSAARTYFNSSPDSLSIQDAAVLVGMLKAGTLFNPRKNKQRSKERRNVVLAQMAKYNFLTDAERDSLQKLDIKLKYKRFDHNEGIALYFREYIRSYMKEWAQANKKVDGTNYDIYQDGLKIYTTINSKMQRYAEAAVQAHMPKLQKQFDKLWKWKSLKKLKPNKGSPWADKSEYEVIARAVKNSHRYKRLKFDLKKSKKEIEKVFNTKVPMTIFTWNGEKETKMTPLDSIRHYKRYLHTGFTAMDPQTGHILAWAGGINFKYFKYDNVRESSKRQVGSTFKPFVYTVAMQNGWSPCRRIRNSPVTFRKYENWTPDGGKYKVGHRISLKEGLAMSLNNITAYLMKQIGPEPVVDIVRKMGITSKVEPFPSICLGTPDISVYEMIGAYGTFANKGFYTKPLTITRIEDKNGNIIQKFPTAKMEVMSEQTAYVMLDLLSNVTEIGTARRLRDPKRYNFKAKIAGKTGTTNDNSDGWFIGIVPKLVSGAWVGGDEKQIHFADTKYGQGANMSLPIWAEFMKRVYADPTLGISQKDKFKKPYPMNIETDCNKYYKAPPINPNRTIGEGENAPDTYNDEFE